MKKQKEVKPYKRIYPENFTFDEVKNILNEVLDLVAQNTTTTAGFMLAKRGLYEQRLRWWRLEYPELQEIYGCIHDIEKEKIQSRLLNNDANATGCIFLLKANHGFIEEEKRLQIESNQSIAELNKDVTIKIGYDDEPTD